MSDWQWVSDIIVFAIHDRQLSEHGGLGGMRDRGAVESALARPRNLAVYGDPDPADLAAVYAFGLARNHVFADGNKRTAWVVARLFLADNGCSLVFDPADAVRMVEALAAGSLPEAAISVWFRNRIRKPGAVSL